MIDVGFWLSTVFTPDSVTDIFACVESDVALYCVEALKYSFSFETRYSHCGSIPVSGGIGVHKFGNTSVPDSSTLYDTVIDSKKVYLSKTSNRPTGLSLYLSDCMQMPNPLLIMSHNGRSF